MIAHLIADHQLMLEIAGGIVLGNVGFWLFCCMFKLATDG